MMNPYLKTVVVSLVLIGISPCFADTSERLKATGESVKGSTQEVVGSITNDPNLKAKGHANKTKAKLRRTKEDVKDIVTGD